jgi:hypothetical protein
MQQAVLHPALGIGVAEDRHRRPGARISLGRGLSRSAIRRSAAGRRR